MLDLTDRGVRALAEADAPDPVDLDRAIAGWLLGLRVDEEGFYLRLGSHRHENGPHDVYWSVYDSCALDLLDEVLRGEQVTAHLRYNLSTDREGSWSCELEDAAGHAARADGWRAYAITLALLRLAVRSPDLRASLTTPPSRPPDEDPA